MFICFVGNNRLMQRQEWQSTMTASLSFLNWRPRGHTVSLSTRLRSSRSKWSLRNSASLVNPMMTLQLVFLLMNAVTQFSILISSLLRVAKRVRSSSSHGKRVFTTTILLKNCSFLLHLKTFCLVFLFLAQGLRTQQELEARWSMRALRIGSRESLTEFK